MSVGIAKELEKKLRKEKKQVPKAIRTLALIDTGAEISIIEEGITEALGIKKTGEAYIRPIGSMKAQCCVKHSVRIEFPGGKTIETTVVSMKLKDHPEQFLVGRDILKKTTFTYSGLNSYFTLRFRD